MQTISWHPVTKVVGSLAAFYLDESVNEFNLTAQGTTVVSLTQLVCSEVQVGRPGVSGRTLDSERFFSQCAVLVCPLFRSLVYLR